MGNPFCDMIDVYWRLIGICLMIKNIQESAMATQLYPKETVSFKELRSLQGVEG